MHVVTAFSSPCKARGVSFKEETMDVDSVYRPYVSTASETSGVLGWTTEGVKIQLELLRSLASFL